MPGRRASLRRVWSAAGYLVARRLLDDPALPAAFPDDSFLQ